MPPAQDVINDTIAARLAARHDGLDILRAVTEACESLLSADATGVLIAGPRGGMEVVVYAFPLRLMQRAVGGLNIFYGSRTELPPARFRLAQSLADLAILGMTQERDERRAERLAEQTLTTLNDRAHLGHAVGVVAGTLGVTANAARDLLSAHSAGTGRSLRELARAVTNGALAPRDLYDTASGT